MKRKMFAAVLCFFIMPVFAMAQVVDKTHQNETAAAEMNNDEGSATEMFVKKAANGGMMEVALGKWAKDNASSQAVKDFGALMVKDHSKANEELKAAAQKTNVMVPAEMNEEKQEKVTEMSKLLGEEFDEEYIDFMVEDHEEDVELFQEASENDEINSEIRNFAQKTLPALKEHLAKAKAIQKNMDSMSNK